MALNFSWIVPDKVGGMARPTADALEWLRDAGVTAVVSLSEKSPEAVDGLEILHVPVPDMTAPTLDQLHELVAFMDQAVDAGGRVVVHCKAGFGRTGTALAAYAVGRGMTAEQAIQFVRTLRPGSIETPEQARAVAEYAELIGGSQ